MKIAAKKTAQGYLVSDKRCDLCEMPLLLMNGNLNCKVCPAIEKWTRKKNIKTSRELGDASALAEITLEETESYNHDLVDFAYNDSPKSKDYGQNSNGERGETNSKKSEHIDTLRLCKSSKAYIPINSAEYAGFHEAQGVVNIQPISDTEQDLHDVLSPCSILTTRFEVCCRANHFLSPVS
jgi:uncharacterized Zn finger protein (UPF0148 family)